MRWTKWLFHILFALGLAVTTNELTSLTALPGYGRAIVSALVFLGAWYQQHHEDAARSRQLQAVVESLLVRLLQDIRDEFDDETARANIMLFKDRRTLEIVVSSNMGTSRDRFIRLNTDLSQGAAGTAVVYGSSARFVRATGDPAAGYGLSDEQVDDTAHLALVLSEALTDPTNGTCVIGVLNVDSERDYAEDDDTVRNVQKRMYDTSTAIAELLMLGDRIRYTRNVGPARRVTRDGGRNV